jgi:hypothetical protein
MLVGLSGAGAAGRAVRTPRLQAAGGRQVRQKHPTPVTFHLAPWLTAPTGGRSCCHLCRHLCQVPGADRDAVAHAVLEAQGVGGQGRARPHRDATDQVRHTYTSIHTHIERGEKRHRERRERQRESREREGGWGGRRRRTRTGSTSSRCHGSGQTHIYVDTYTHRERREKT